MAKIITLGELLIDLTQKDTDEHGNGIFVAYPGGAPANVAVATSRLGAESAFIGKVGDDAFGRSLADTLFKEKVDIQGLYYSKEEPTTMAIVSVDETGERDFSFYRNPGADTRLTADEAVAAIKKLINDSAGADDKNDKGTFTEIKTITAGEYLIPDENDSEKPFAGILHIGSLSLTTSPSREATIAAIEYAKSKGMLISYDPNYRAALWDSEYRAVEEMKSLLPYADILKVSDEEMEMLTGTSDLEEGSSMLHDMSVDNPTMAVSNLALHSSMVSDDSAQHSTENPANSKGISLVMVTLGADGVFVRLDGSRFSQCGRVPGYNVDVADTNGAGDTFLGAVLAQISGKIEKRDKRYISVEDNSCSVDTPKTDMRVNLCDDDLVNSETGRITTCDALREINWNELTDMVRYANRAASVTCSRHGAIPAMPFANELH